MHRIVSIACLLTLSSAAALAQPAPATPQTVIVPTTVVSKQGNVAVTFADIDAFAQRIPEKERAVYFNSPKRIESTILNILLQKQLAAQAREEGLENDPAVKQQIDLSADEALSRARMARFKTEIKVPDLTALAQETYIGNKEKYVIPGRLDVKQVLITTHTRNDEEAKALADTVEKEAVAHPDQFDALIDKYSEDTSKVSNHGLIEGAANNKYAPAFSTAAEALKKVGDISPVVKTKYGYHILQLVGRTQSKQREFADVRDEIVKQLRDDYIEKAVNEHTDALRNQPLDANPDAVASLRTRYGTVPAAPADGAVMTPPTATQ